MTTGRINQVTWFCPDHDIDATAVDVREPGIQWSCKKQSQQRNQMVRSRQKPSHKSNATLESLTSRINPKQRSRAHSRVCIRNIATLVNHTNSVQIRLLKPRLEHRSVRFDSCSPPPHETCLISHDGTETHSPIQHRIGLAVFQQLTQPEARWDVAFRLIVHTRSETSRITSSPNLEAEGWETPFWPNYIRRGHERIISKYNHLGGYK